MTVSQILSWPVAGAHDSLKEGTRLGVIVATVIWIWIAAVDAVAGAPFGTFALLGGVVAFSVIHYLLNIVYGIVLVSVVHGAERTPSLIVGAIFWLLTFEGGIAMLTNLLVEARLGGGSISWVAIFGGNLLGAVVAFVLLFRTHPLGAYLHRAEEEN